MAFGEELFDILNNPYVLAGVLLGIFTLLMSLILYVLKHYLMHVFRKGNIEVDEQILRKSHKPVFWALLFVGLKLSITPILMPLETGVIVHRLLDSAITVFVIYAIHAITNTIIEYYVTKVNRHTTSNYHNELLPFVNYVSKIAYTALAMICVLKAWDVNIQPFLAGLGILGLAVGLAMQTTLSNIIGGMALLLDKNFNIGDEIKLESDIEGTVLDIGLRSTKIRTKNHELIIVPNNTLATSKITNYAKPTTKLRIYVDLEISKDANIDKILRTIAKRCSKLEFIEHGTHPNVSITSIAQNSTKIRVYFWVNILKVERSKAQETLGMIVYEAANAK
jgi:MscS family membrane protein